MKNLKKQINDILNEMENSIEDEIQCRIEDELTDMGYQIRKNDLDLFGLQIDDDDNIDDYELGLFIHENFSAENHKYSYYCGYISGLEDALKLFNNI